MNINNDIVDLKLQIEKFVNNKTVDKKVDNFDEMSWSSHIDTIFENMVVTYDKTDIEEENFLKVVTEILEEKNVFQINFCREGKIYATITVPYIQSSASLGQVILTTGIEIKIL